MNTSNKILIGALALILLSITIFIVVFGRLMRFDDVPESNYSTGQAEQQRTLPHFNKVRIDAQFNVHYTQDTFQRVILKADNSLIQLALTEVNDGELHLYSKHRISGNRKVEVFVTTDSINQVEANGGGTFRTIQKIRVKRFDSSGNGGGVFKVDGDFSDLNLELNAGAVGSFSGTCDNMNIESNAGAVINAGGMKAKNANISTSAGAINNIYVTDQLSVMASAGSIVKCQGAPDIKNMNISSGAQFLK
jgi:hypothetical protein